MKIKEPRTKKCLISFIILFVCQYGLEHLTYLVANAAYSGSINITASFLSAVYTLVSYLVGAIEILSISAAALVILLRLVNRGVIQAFMLSGAFLATKLFYIIPHYYMSYISYGYDSFEALFLIIPTALFILLMALLELTAAIALGSLPAIISARYQEFSYRDLLAEDLQIDEPWDVGNKGTAAMLIICAVLSVKSFISAIITSITFFVRYGTSYSIGDIFIVLFDLILPLLLILISYLAVRAIKIRIAAGTEEEDDGENNTEIE